MPHVTLQSVLPAQIALQLPSHLMLQVDESVHVIMLASPTWSLQVALVLHTATADAASLKSQLELALHVTWLASPPMPLQAEESLQTTDRASVELPLHLDEAVQLSEHALSPHSVLQSVPATHAHAESVQVQPVPAHVGAPPLSPPHATPAIAIQNKTLVTTRIALASSFMTAVRSWFVAAKRSQRAAPGRFTTLPIDGRPEGLPRYTA